MSRRGMTLVELLVGLAVGSIVMAGVVAVFIGVQRVYQNEAQVLTAVDSGRTAVSYLEQTLTLAGYGVPPPDAFDFTVTGGAAKDNAADATVKFVTDDLAFRYRDPGFLRRGTLKDGMLTLLSPDEDSGETPEFGITLPARTALLVACNGATRWAFLRSAGGIAAAGSSASLTVERVAPDTSIADECYTQTGDELPYVFRVHERRLRVVPLEGRPYLVVFHNLDAPDPSVNTAWEPLASDVESFQVAYQLNRPSLNSKCCKGAAAPDATGNSNWIIGDAAAEALPLTDATGPRYGDEYDHARRFQNHASNIRMVRVSLLLRSKRDRGAGEAAVFDPVPLENAPPPAPGAASDGYYRYVVQTAVRTPNLGSRAFFLPPLRKGLDDPGERNLSGG